MPVELHLPDLPEVPLSLGSGDAPRTPARTPWTVRARDALSSYLPLLLMALLALGTWWLVKHTPTLPPSPADGSVRREPDYTMTQFAVERFGRDGRLRIRLDGDRLRHYPDNGRYEVDGARIRAISADGTVTLASARQARANADLSEVELLGGARVDSRSPRGTQLQVRSEFLHAFLSTEQLRTHLPVQVNDGRNTLDGAAMTYDHKRQLLELTGRVRARLVDTAMREVLP